MSSPAARVGILRSRGTHLAENFYWYQKKYYGIDKKIRGDGHLKSGAVLQNCNLKTGVNIISMSITYFP